MIFILRFVKLIVFQSCFLTKPVVLGIFSSVSPIYFSRFFYLMNLIFHTINLFQGRLELLLVYENTFYLPYILNDQIHQKQF